MRRLLFRGLGLASVGAAIVGVALPIMPTVPFLILAAFCFSRSDPQWADRLHDHPRYGQSLRDWRDRRAISRKGKIAAIAAMACGVIFTTLVVGFPLAFISIAVLVVCGPWIWTRNE